VHAVLAAIPPGSSQEEISKVANLQGRILGATKEEILAASVSTKAALAHPLLERARNALARGQCRHETPITITLADGSIVEGIVDLAFLEGEGWTVVDFKTDRELAKQVQYYKRQVALYSSAIALATKKKSRGILLSI
jgi:ATP-dependent exoDNAse (exonuclease V) beta subunit